MGKQVEALIADLAEMDQDPARIDTSRWDEVSKGIYESPCGRGLVRKIPTGWSAHVDTSEGTIMLLRPSAGEASRAVDQVLKEEDEKAC